MSKIKKIKALTMAYENCNKASISITEAISTKIGLKETESNKACTRLICKKSYELVRFSRSYKVRRVEYGHGRDKSEEEVKYGTMNSSEADLTVDISKLLSFAVAHLILCSYFMYKIHLHLFFPLKRVSNLKELSPNTHFYMALCSRFYDFMGITFTRPVFCLKWTMTMVL